MSIGSEPIGAGAIAVQSDSATGGKGPPPKRTIAAKADAVSRPEPR